MAENRHSWEESIKQEIKEIDKHHKLVSEKSGQDVSFTAAALDWIEKHAADFRKRWNEGS